jgi:hypothetical protein
MRLSMLRPMLSFSLALAAWISLWSVGPALAATVDLTTPEGAVSAYIDGVARRDFNAIIAVTSADKFSKGFDFVANLGRVRALTPKEPAPATDPFFVEINKAEFVARIAQQMQMLTYGLMSTNDFFYGGVVLMDKAKATDFANSVRADRPAGLKLVKIGTPKIANSKKYQANFDKSAKTVGADTGTERLALVSFEGHDFEIGFTLLRYGDQWTVDQQVSSNTASSTSGAPRRVTQEEFEKMLQQVSAGSEYQVRN